METMKFITTLLVLVFIYIDFKFQIRNSILFMELIFLIAFYFGGRYAASTLRHRKRKTEALKSDRGYRNPKEIKSWQQYQSGTRVQRTRELDYFDKI